MDQNTLRNIVEAAILTSEVPVTINQIQSLFDPDEKPSANDVQQALKQLAQQCEGRAVELKQIGQGYRYQSREDYSEWLQRLSEIRPRRYSRALMETLSIIAFRQPVTRGDIESIRGVSVSTEIMRTLLTNEWIEQAGYKEVPGRPALFVTTAKFLEYFNLQSLQDLPALDLLERQAAKAAQAAKDGDSSQPL